MHRNVPRSQRCLPSAEAQRDRNPNGADLSIVQHLQILEQLTSTEFTVNNRAIEVWLIAVPMVAWGGFVGPCVPVAITPGKKLCPDTRRGLAAAKRKNVVVAKLRIIVGEVWM